VFVVKTGDTCGQGSAQGMEHGSGSGGTWIGMQSLSISTIVDGEKSKVST